MPGKHNIDSLFTEPEPTPAASEEAQAQREALLRRFLELTEFELPARAREQRWPIRLDHCFKRICLDHAFGDVWYKHLRRPAERHLQGEPLRRAVDCAESLLTGNASLLAKRNHQSLGWRGKLGKM